MKKQVLFLFLFFVITTQSEFNFGFPRLPFPLISRRWTPNLNLSISAEPREKEDDKVATEAPTEANVQIFKIMKELNSIRKIVDQMAKDHAGHDPIVISENKNRDSEVRNQESEQNIHNLASAESNFELLNTIGMIVGRKSCPENLFRCQTPERNPMSIFSVLPQTSPTIVTSSASTSSFAAIFPGMVSSRKIIFSAE